MSNKRIGCENFGKFYTEGKVRNRREWRGVTDTLYDYSRWLHNWITMAKMVSKPRNIKAMFRYRWMANYLAVPMMVDRHTQGLRDEYLRICHLEQDLIIEDVAKLLDGLFRGDRRIGKDKKFSDKVVLVDENEMTAVMMGFPTLKGLSRETPSTYVSVLLNQHAAEHYIDVAQEYGLAGDVCPMPEAEAGVSIDDDAPVLGACAVQCNTTCDGSLLGNGVISKRLELEDGIPVFQLAAPLRHREDDVQDYAAQEIKNAIAFIEEHTGEKWDWKAYFECAERVNYATKCRLEWLEMNKTDYPQVFGSNLALYTETNYMAICGKVPAFREVDRKITQFAERAYRKQKKAANEYRHRAIVWGVQSHFYMDFLVWLLNCWGIVPLTDMLSMVSTRELATTDTPENREQAYYDMAWLTENMIMRNRTHGGYKVLLDELWEFCEQFNADMVILWERVNYATKCRLEWLEMNKTDYPQVFGSNLALYTETNYMAICGKVPAFREVDRKITQFAERAYRKQKKAANEYRHRAIVWGVQSHFYMDFLVWLLNCWGIVPLTDMLSMVSTRELATTDTPENREQAYYDMAWLTENMIMRNRTHGGYKVLLDELWEFCEQFNADMVILWEHMSCKALDGMHGLFEERAREHGIHLVWVTHDLFDPRVISRQGVRQQVNDYMRTVMQEEPVDPSLEILKDEKSW